VLEARGHDPRRKDPGPLAGSPGAVLLLQFQNARPRVVTVKKRLVRSHLLKEAKTRERRLGQLLDALELRGGRQRDTGPALPLFQPMVWHPESIAHHCQDRVHTRVVLVAVGLRRHRRREGLLAAGAAKDVPHVDGRLHWRRALQLHILVLGELVELAPTARLGAWTARLQIAVRTTHTFGTWIVLGTETSVTLFLTA